MSKRKHTESSKNPETTPSKHSASDISRQSKFCLEPFPHASFPNFLTKTELASIKTHTSNLDLQPKSNDLYNYDQTTDILKNQQLKFLVTKLQQFAIVNLYPETDFYQKPYTDIELSMFYAEYKTNDHLLCHDDKVNGRRFAYIIYLSEDWKDEDGGHLDLFEKDIRTVSKSLLPKFGSLVVFEVCPGSYHQVREVLSKHKVRKTLTGWFMGETDWMKENDTSQNKAIHSKIKNSEELFDDFNFEDGCFRDMNDVTGILQSFHDDRETLNSFQQNNEVSLDNFLKPEVFKMIETELKDLSASDSNWNFEVDRLGGHFQVADLKSKDFEPSKSFCDDYEAGCEFPFDEKYPYISGLLRCFTSGGFSMYLQFWTGLSLDYLNNFSGESPGAPSMHSGSLKRWRKGGYSLAREQAEHDFPILDLFMRFCVEENYDPVKSGGEITYIQAVEDAGVETENHGDRKTGDPNSLTIEEALEETIEESLNCFAPSKNQLKLVFRDKNTRFFNRYINDNFGDGEFFEFHFQYKQAMKNSHEILKL